MDTSAPPSPTGAEELFGFASSRKSRNMPDSDADFSGTEVSAGFCSDELDGVGCSSEMAADSLNSVSTLPTEPAEAVSDFGSHTVRSMGDECSSGADVITPPAFSTVDCDVGCEPDCTLLSVRTRAAAASNDSVSSTLETIREFVRSGVWLPFTEVVERGERTAEELDCEFLRDSGLLSPEDTCVLEVRVEVCSLPACCSRNPRSFGSIADLVPVLVVERLRNCPESLCDCCPTAEEQCTTETRIPAKITEMTGKAHRAPARRFRLEL